MFSSPVQSPVHVFQLAYDKRLKQKLNLEELINAIKQKLRIWRWRDLTIIGRIQIVKTFIIPIFLYQTSLLCFDKEFLKNSNTIIYDFIWKSKDKVKHSAIISDIEDGGLKAPHLETIIETQKMLSCKKLANDQAASWKTILRTVPTIVIAHTFCASPDTRISYRRYLLIQGYFCAV